MAENKDKKISTRNTLAHSRFFSSTLGASPATESRKIWRRLFRASLPPAFLSSTLCLCGHWIPDED